MNHSRILLTGLGPAGLAFLLQLTEKRPDITRQVLAVEQGASLPERLNQKRETVDRGELTRGFGGAGLFSDGKFCLSLHVGGRLDRNLNSVELVRLERLVDRMFAAFDGNSHITHPKVNGPGARCLAGSGLAWTPYPVRHYGTDQLRQLNSRIFQALVSRGIKFEFSTQLVDVKRSSTDWIVVLRKGTEDREEVFDKVVLAVGKRGARWLDALASRIGLACEAQPVRFGIRIEAPRVALARLLEVGLDPKVFFWDGSHKTKLHCFCDGGEVLALDYDGIRVIGGHSAENAKTPWTNFGVLTEVLPTQGRRTAETALNLLRPFISRYPGLAVAEPLTTFLYQSEPAELPAGTLSRHGHVRANVAELLDQDVYGRICEFLKRLIAVTGDGWLSEAAVYAPAIEWWYDAVRLNPLTMETTAAGMYAIGDGSGWSQGIVHAAAMGVIAADGLLHDSEPTRR